jgi:excisionase family DNA binding protein
MSRIMEKLCKIEEKIDALFGLVEGGRKLKEWYTTAEVGQLLDRGKYTVREWCREGRIRAEKRPAGRGKAKEWMISAEEVERFKNYGLRPLRE